MFDNMRAFTGQFTPVAGGYVYYPSRKAGGKLVTAQEYEQLVAGWGRIAGTRGLLIASGLVVLSIVLWTLISQSLALPEWTDWIIIVASVAAISGWFLWFSLAPRRLVRGRPDATPPRPVSQARREARAVLTWPFVIFALLISGAVFFGSLNSFDGSTSGWAWVIGSGLCLAAYLWDTIGKLQDRGR